MSEPLFIGPDGKAMVPLRCQSCGEQVGVRQATGDIDPSRVVVRCYRCAAVEEAETITKGAA